VETGAAAAAGAGPAIERGGEPAVTESGSVVRADRQRSVDEDPAKSGAMQRVSERAAGPGPRVVPVDAPPDRAGAGVREIETGANAPAMIRNAGLVILHPFIASIFNATGIAEGGRLGDDGGTIARAAAILHYLATGREEAYEFELGMARLLLGAEPDVPMHVAAGALHPGDAEEADALLASAIGHWKLLGNTSADALRGSFLARPGLLRRDGAGWRLHIEPAPFDMLLGGLPWSIAIVKLPWMRRPIHTEWMAP
jgi:hypothetical protein